MKTSHGRAPEQRNRRKLRERIAGATALLFFAAASCSSGHGRRPAGSSGELDRDGRRWIGTWATAPQAARPARLQIFRNQSVRLIAHTSAGGTSARVRISNTFGDAPLFIGGARLARRTACADIDPTSDRVLTFGGRASVRVPPGSMAVSDPVDLDVPPLSDVAVSLFFPEPAAAATSHSLALQTSYVSAETGDATSAASFPVARTIGTWPFLTGIDVATSPGAASIVAFGASHTDGDGSTKDANHRWPDVLAERLQKAGGREAALGVLNEGIIGNRLLRDIHSPGQTGGPFESVLQELGPILGAAGVERFQRDVLEQPGVRYVVIGIGVNDLLFPGAFTPVTESVTARSVIEGNRRLIARAHERGIRAIGMTIPPFEDATFQSPTIHFSTPEKEAMRREVNAWIRSGGEFDGVIDFDEVVKDPNRPTRLLPEYDSGDHLHPNDAGYIATANAISLELFRNGRAGADAPRFSADQRTDRAASSR